MSPPSAAKVPGPGERTKKQTLADIFKPPYDIMFQGTFHEVCDSQTFQPHANIEARCLVNMYLCSLIAFTIYPLLLPATISPKTSMKVLNQVY